MKSHRYSPEKKDTDATYSISVAHTFTGPSGDKRSFYICIYRWNKKDVELLEPNEVKEIQTHFSGEVDYGSGPKKLKLRTPQAMTAISSITGETKHYPPIHEPMDMEFWLTQVTPDDLLKMMEDKTDDFKDCNVTVSRSRGKDNQKSTWWQCFDVTTDNKEVAIKFLQELSTIININNKKEKTPVEKSAETHKPKL